MNALPHWRPLNIKSRNTITDFVSLGLFIITKQNTFQESQPRMVLHVRPRVQCKRSGAPRRLGIHPELLDWAVSGPLRGWTSFSGLSNFLAYLSNQSKWNWTNRPLRNYLRQPLGSWRVARYRSRYGVLLEIWKEGGPSLHSKLHELPVCC